MTLKDLDFVCVTDGNFFLFLSFFVTEKKRGTAFKNGSSIKLRLFQFYHPPLEALLRRGERRAPWFDAFGSVVSWLECSSNVCAFVPSWDFRSWTIPMINSRFSKVARVCHSQIHVLSRLWKLFSSFCEPWFRFANIFHFGWFCSVKPDLNSIGLFNWRSKWILHVVSWLKLFHLVATGECRFSSWAFFRLFWSSCGILVVPLFFFLFIFSIWLMWNLFSFPG